MVVGGGGAGRVGGHLCGPQGQQAAPAPILASVEIHCRGVYKDYKGGRNESALLPCTVASFEGVQ